MKKRLNKNYRHKAKGLVQKIKENKKTNNPFGIDRGRIHLRSFKEYKIVKNQGKYLIHVPIFFGLFWKRLVEIRAERHDGEIRKYLHVLKFNTKQEAIDFAEDNKYEEIK